MIGVVNNENIYNECVDSMSIYQLFGLVGYKSPKNNPITLPNNVVSCLDFICQRSILKDDDRASLREFKLSKMIFSSCTIQEKTAYKSLTGKSLKEDFDNDNIDSYISHDGYVRIFIVKDKDSFDSFSDDGNFWIEAYNIYNLDDPFNPEANVYSIFIPEKFNIESNFIAFLFEFCEIYLHHTSLIKNGIKVKKELNNGQEAIHLTFNNPRRILSIQQSLFIYYYYATVFRMMKQIIPDINEEDISQLSLNTDFRYIFSKIFKDAIVNGKYLNYNTDSSDNVDPDTIVDISRAFADSSDN